MGAVLTKPAATGPKIPPVAVRERKCREKLELKRQTVDFERGRREGAVLTKGGATGPKVPF